MHLQLAPVRLRQLAKRIAVPRARPRHRSVVSVHLRRFPVPLSPYGHRPGRELGGPAAPSSSPRGLHHDHGPTEDRHDRAGQGCSRLRRRRRHRGRRRTGLRGRGRDSLPDRAPPGGRRRGRPGDRRRGRPAEAAQVDALDEQAVDGHCSPCDRGPRRHLVQRIGVPDATILGVPSGEVDVRASRCRSPPTRRRTSSPRGWPRGTRSEAGRG